MKKNLLKLALIFVLSLSFSLPVYGEETNYISEVFFKNVQEQTLTSKIFYSVFNIKPGFFYSEQQIISALDEFSLLLPYIVKKWNINDKLLSVYISKKQTINKISFSGNSSFYKKQLLQTIGFEPVGAFYEDLNKIIEERIIKFYQSHGYYDPKITWTKKTIKKNNRLDIICHINEGVKAVFTDINITVIGNVELDKIKKIINIKKGDTASTINVQQSVKKLRKYLYDRGYYSQNILKNSLIFNPEMTEAVFSFLINLGPRFRIIFRGNNIFINTRSMFDALGISEYDTLNVEFYRVLKLRLKNYYAKVGLANVDVDVYEELSTQEGEINLVFDIKESSRKYLRSVIILSKNKEVGNQIYDYTKTLYDNFIQNGIFVKDILYKIKLDIKNYLEQKGYLKSRIKDVQYKEIKKNVFEAIYDIDEGDRTKVRSLNIKGNSFIDNKNIFEILKINRNDYLDMEILESGIRQLILKHKSNGFIDFAIDKNALMTYSKDYRFVDINLNISEGKAYSVGDIFIEGLNKTKTKVVSRELQFKKGEVLDLSVLQDTESKLVALGLFRSVNISILKSSENKINGYKLHRDILVKLEEKKVGEYEFGFGYRTDEGIRVFTGIAYNNLGGWNRRISADAIISRKLDNEFKFLEYDFLISYYEPYLLDIPLNFRTSVEFAKEDLVGFDRRKFDLAFYFEKKLGKRHSLILRNAFERVNVFNAVYEDDNDIYWKYSIRQMYQYDSRDSYFNTSKGIKFYIYAEWGRTLQSYDTATYIKIVNKGKIYIPVLDNWMLAPSIGTGCIRSLSNSYLLIDDRFALGGSNSIRGFKEGVVNDMSSELKIQYFYTFSFELRRNLIWNLAGLAFYDIGNLYSHSTNTGRPYSSVGGGLSFAFAVGSLSFEYGYIYDRTRRLPPDRVGRLHLTIQ